MINHSVLCVHPQLVFSFPFKFVLEIYNCPVGKLVFTKRSLTGAFQDLVAVDCGGFSRRHPSDARSLSMDCLRLSVWMGACAVFRAGVCAFAATAA